MARLIWAWALAGTAALAAALAGCSDTFTVTPAVSPSGAGSVALVPEGPYNAAATVQATATANTGYRFDHWAGDLTGSANPATLAVGANANVTAVFVHEVRYALVLDVSPAGTGIVAANPEGPYDAGATVQVTASATAGYSFDHWEGNLGGDPNPATVTMDGNKTATAMFVQQFTLTMATQGKGSVTPAEGVSVYGAGDDVLATAKADAGWWFDHWEITGVTPNPATPGVTVHMDADKTATAVFVEQFILTVVKHGNGEVSVSFGSDMNVVGITATPDTGWRFDHWEITGISPDPATASYTVHLDADATATAVFIQQFTLTMAQQGGGTITPAAGSAVYDVGTDVAVTATPGAGWQFDHWEIAGVSPNPATASATISCSPRHCERSEAIPWALLLTSVRSPGDCFAPLAMTGSVHMDADKAAMAVFVREAMIAVSAGTFVMGNSGVGDDMTLGNPDELPTHSVQLAAYQIGGYDVTNEDYAGMLNWALGKGYVQNSAAAAYDGGDVYAKGQVLISITDAACNLLYSGGTFSPKTRTGQPGTTAYPMGLHPVAMVSWHGAAMYCNWLSESQGLTPCYDTTAWACATAAGGYHLPTEAQWERAAAWDPAGNGGAGKHWIYGFMSDTLAGKNRCNYAWLDGADWVNVNPLGLADEPCTSPAAWFNGVNISPNGDVQTLDSPSPAGCYDMSGNVLQWCTDWYGAYAPGSATDPTGPTTGTTRVLRGGSWRPDSSDDRRSAARFNFDPTRLYPFVGFRLAQG